MNKDKQECRGFGGGFKNEAGEWENYDLNSICAHCVRFNPTIEKPLQSWIGWAGETENCDYFKKKP